MVLLDNDGVSFQDRSHVVYKVISLVSVSQFLSGLTKLFQQTRSSGSIFLTMKKCKYRGQTIKHSLVNVRCCACPILPSLVLKAKHLGGSAFCNFFL